MESSNQIVDAFSQVSWWSPVQNQCPDWQVNKKDVCGVPMRLGRKHIKLNENSGWRIWGLGTIFFFF